MSFKETDDVHDQIQLQGVRVDPHEMSNHTKHSNYN